MKDKYLVSYLLCRQKAAKSYNESKSVDLYKKEKCKILL